MHNQPPRRDSAKNDKKKTWLLLGLGFGLGFILSAVTLLNLQVVLQLLHPANTSSSGALMPDEQDHPSYAQGSNRRAASSSEHHMKLRSSAETNQVITKSAPKQTSTLQSTAASSSPLLNLRILVAIAAFDFTQIPHLEDVLDSYHDIAVAGARVDVVIHATVAYPVTYIDLLNSRFTNTNFSIRIVLKPSTLRLHLVDCHRDLFYDNIDNYDLFIYTEEDIRVTPRTVATYLEESSKIQQLLSTSTDYSFSDFNVGIVRYEHNYPSNVVIDDKTRHAIQNVSRVYWEHSSFKPPAVPNAVDVVPQGNGMSERYVHMRNHHQGMFLATRDLLLAWKDRPNCNFNIVKDRPGTKSQPTEGTQRVWMSSQQLFGKRHCNVQQVLPMDKFGALTVHHVPNKNYRRVGKYRKRQFSDGTEEFEQSPDLLTALQLHLLMRQTWLSKPQYPYQGAITMVDEVSQKRSPLLERRMDDYRAYILRGGVLSEQDYMHTAFIEDS